MSTDALPQPDPALLPDDPAVLKQLVVQLRGALQKANARLERQEHHIDLLLKRIYGSTSEKFDPRQGVLFDPQAGADETASNTPAPLPATPVSKNRDRHGRGRIPDDTKREEVVHDLTDAEKAALGGEENLVELPPETSAQLDWQPSTLFVVVHVRKKCARKEQLPESGLTLAEQTWRWLASHVIHTDDTTVKIRNAREKRKYTARFWPTVGDPLHGLTVFDYTATRERAGPAAFLKGYRGYVQADAFSGYDGIYLESAGRIIAVGCWAHARRKYVESRRLDPARWLVQQCFSQRCPRHCWASQQWHPFSTSC